MKKLIILFCMIFIAVLLIDTNFAQRRMHANQGMGYNRLYGESTVETFKGTVINVTTFKPDQYIRNCVRFNLITNNDTISVHIGPSWYLNYKNFSIKEGDKVIVTGSKVVYNDKPAVIASHIKTNDTKIELRNSQGFPLWSRWNDTD
jgi:ribosomal protein S12